MPFDVEQHHRRSIRLPGYDYSQAGAYFVTVCTNQRSCLFGQIVDTTMLLNGAGHMVQDVWNSLPWRFPQLELDAYIVMPNHVPGIIVFAPYRKTAMVADLRQPLGDIVGAFKSIVTHDYVVGVRQYSWKPFAGTLWQRNYYEHIIRDEASLQRVREYIEGNPAQWMNDAENPDRQAQGRPQGSPLP